MLSEVKDVLEVRRKLVLLNYAKACGNTAQAYREFVVPKASYYRLKEPSIKMEVLVLFEKNHLPEVIQDRSRMSMLIRYCIYDVNTI